MDGWIICRNGVDTVVYIAGNDSQYSGAWPVVYSGGGIVVYDWCDILFMAPDEVFACRLAPVCNRGQCVLLFCSAVRVYPGFIKKTGVRRFFIG